MKKLFILALLPLIAGAAPARKPEAKPAPVPAEAPAPAPVRERKPGFWERAWTSTKKGSSAIGRTVTRPFRGGGGKEKASSSEVGWRNLSMSLTLEPAQVKLPETRAIRVGLAVINKGKAAVQLEFPTTQRIEVLVKTENGKVLSKWSEDQKVDEEQGFLVINPEERLEYSANVSTREMSAGNSYVIEAYFPNFDQLRASRTIMPVK